MPDILTHILVGLSVGLLIRGKIRDDATVMVATGSVVIDIERPIGWIFDYLGISTNGITSIFHTMFGAIVLSIVVTLLFERTSIDDFWRFVYCFIGALSHLLMDMTLFPLSEKGVYLFYPLMIPFSFNIFWSDFIFFPLIGLSAFAIAVSVVHIRGGKPFSG